MKNKIEDLRNHLFMAIEGLMDEEKPMDLERARAVSQTAQTLINSAKVEVDFLKVTGGIEGSGFIPYEPRKPKLVGGNVPAGGGVAMIDGRCKGERGVGK